MRALRIHGPRDMRYEETADPVPGPGQLAVRVEAVGLCRTDIEVYENRLYHYKVGKAKLPVIPGHEWSGVVESVAPDVTDVRPGDRVTCETALGCGHCQLCLSGHGNICQSRIEVGIINYDGAMADVIIAPRSTLHSIGSMPFEIGAFVEPTAVSVYAVRVAQVTPADRVLVLGAGPIGQLLTQVARAYGARQVVTVARREAKLALAERLGADATINSSRADLAEAAAELTDGEGFDVVLEAAGATELFPAALLAAAIRGRVVLTGSFVGNLAPTDLDLVVCKELSIAGTVGGAAHYDEAISLLASGRVQAEPLITARLPLREAPRVFEEHAEGAGDSIKVIFSPRG
jgi:L-iditol 2-dehydrogenase